MARQGGAGAGRAGQSVPEAPDLLDALIGRLNADLLHSETSDEMERRAKTISIVVKAQQGLQELARLQQELKGEDGHMDAVDEQALRDRLLARLDGLVAGLEQKGAGRCSACGSVAPDRQGLERVVAQLSETD